MIASIIVALTLSPVYASDCVPLFYKSTPRDQEWTYAAGSGEDAAAARAAAAKSLAMASGINGTGFEQDDYARCGDTHYILLRVEKARVAEAKADKTNDKKIDEMGGRVDFLSGRQDSDRARIEREERDIAAIQASPAGPITVYDTTAGREVRAPSLAQTAVYRKDLDPRIRRSMDNIDSGLFDARDVAMVVAGLNTKGDMPALAKFCGKITGEDLSFQPGLRSWVLGQCVKAGGL